ncbi:hypothetical protein NZD85_09745 [Empedobacter stercoris]|uniref:hypothetical protein n=1 Tax=Empedobacter stercoris TaxID=1628248 RepID=UPI0021AFCBD4|nr:hypothetical protein [Empedobacter stercoris]UWX66177.1 hypothetical protein NZD85_09745 [Empedobacter stercoris]
MKQIELTHSFWKFNQTHSLGASAIAFYLFLLNKYADNNYESLVISDIEIKNELNLSRPTIIATKVKLRNLGLIQYKTTRGLPCRYQLLNINIWEKEEKPIQIKEIPSKKEDADKEINRENINKTKASLNNKKTSIPAFSEFIEYTRTLKGYNETLDPFIEAKYDSWVQNDWKNGYDRPITNWQSSIRSTLPYLNNQQQNQKITVPKIHRPKTTYNE